MFTTIFLLVVAALGVALLLLCVGIILRKDGRFSSQDVGQSTAMRERGIHCFRTQDRLAQADKSSLNDMMSAPNDTND